VEATNNEESLKPGATAQISIQAGAIPGAVVVPIAALLSSDEGGEKVMLAGADGLAHEQDVKTGVRSGDLVQILEGVKPGDKVITQGALGLDDKAKIVVARAQAQEKPE
jgi:membrane fusion protein (multidrug efflux system)